MKTRRLLLVLILGLVGLNGKGQVTFQKRYNSNYQYFCNAAKQTTDGGYIFTGFRVVAYNDNDDAYFMRTNAFGDTLWIRTFGGLYADWGESIEQTPDGGFVLTGFTESFSSPWKEILLIKIDANGELMWIKTMYGGNDDWAKSVHNTSDGGLIIGGITHSFQFTGYTDDAFLIKTNAVGDTIWTHTYGGLLTDCANSVIQTTDGGYIFAGYTNSFSIGNNFDFYLVKTNSIGDTLWTKTYGGTGDDEAMSVWQNSDGGYIIAGSTESFGAGGKDVYLIRTDSIGDTLWTKTYGGIYLDIGASVQQTTDGGFIIVGYTESFSSSDDIYLIKVNSNGDTLWTRIIGDAGLNETGSSVQQTTDGGFIIGASWGASTCMTCNSAYLIKTDSNGNSGCHQLDTTSIVGTTATHVIGTTTSRSTGTFTINNPILTSTFLWTLPTSMCINSCYSIFFFTLTQPLPIIIGL